MRAPLSPSTCRCLSKESTASEGYDGRAWSYLDPFWKPLAAAGGIDDVIDTVKLESGSSLVFTGV